MFRSCGRDDYSPGCRGNGDAGNQLGNPDVRAPKRTAKDDGLCVRRAEEEKNTNNEEEGREDAEDRSRNGNSTVPLKINDQPWEKKRAETRELCHVPGGTWLTKVAVNQRLGAGKCGFPPSPTVELFRSCAVGHAIHAPQAQSWFDKAEAISDSERAVIPSHCSVSGIH
ncbi:hypothetical protein NDU88_003284 [Pleurodeles waltl]|uniref:Uncharacterized protein n=1 Tax=Pleurodeles waltl TaxID=8319 RepID=A0AAV7M4R7_PLEWA|nr:hypothetical protein NDU88_003284 [Pleurodeles waltl]